MNIAIEGGGEREASFAALSVGAAEHIRKHVGGAGSVRKNENILYAASLRDRVLAGAPTLQLGGAVAMGFLVWRYMRRLDRGDGLESGVRPEFLNGVITFVDEHAHPHSPKSTQWIFQRLARRARLPLSTWSKSF